MNEWIQKWSSINLQEFNGLMWVTILEHNNISNQSLTIINVIKKSVLLFLLLLLVLSFVFLVLILSVTNEWFDFFFFWNHWFNCVPTKLFYLGDLLAIKKCKIKKQKLLSRLIDEICLLQLANPVAFFERILLKFKGNGSIGGPKW